MKVNFACMNVHPVMLAFIDPSYHANTHALGALGHPHSGSFCSSHLVISISLAFTYLEHVLHFVVRFNNVYFDVANHVYIFSLNIKFCSQLLLILFRDLERTRTSSSVHTIPSCVRLAVVCLTYIYYT